MSQILRSSFDFSRRKLLRGTAALAVGAPLIGVGLPGLSLSLIHI